MPHSLSNLFCFLGATLLFAALMLLFGYEDTYKLWSVPTLNPHFADLRVITHGAETYAEGLDPLITNPHDPWNRTLNYPRVWHLLYRFGVDSSHTTLLGVLLISSFILGVCTILINVDRKTGMLIIFLIFSPAALFGIERANIDLLIFFIISVSISAAQRGPIFATLAILAGFFLKLYPIFSALLLLRFDRKLFLTYAFALVFLVGLYVWINHQELLLISEATPRETKNAYGINVLWMRIAGLYPSLERHLQLFSYVVASIFAVFFASLAALKPSLDQPQSSFRHLDAFRAGAAIYVGTFLLGNSFDYRLVFLIFTIPQIILWARIDDYVVRTTSRLLIASIFLSFWHLAIMGMLYPDPIATRTAFIIDEIANWVIFFGLAFLIVRSLPPWATRWSTNLLESITRADRHN